MTVAVCIFSNDTKTTLHTYSFLLYFYSSQSVEYNNRWIRAGRDEAERNGTGPTRVAKETRDGTEAGANGYVFCHFLILSTLLSFSFFFFPVVSFSTEYNDRRGGWGVTDAVETTYRSRPPWEVGGQRVRVLLFFVLYSPLLFFSLFLFSDYLFFAKIINRRRSRSDWAVAAARTLAARPVLSAAGGAAATPPTIAIAR